MKPVPHGKPYAGKLHVRFDEGAGVPTGRPALLYTLLSCCSPFWKNAAKAECTANAAAEVGAVYVDAGHLGDKVAGKITNVDWRALPFQCCF